MSKRDEALEILTSLGMPKGQLNERSCLTLLALAGVAESDEWQKASRPLLRILDIMTWMKEKYGKAYAPNSRETVRRQTVHQFEQARIIDRNPDDPRRPTNSGDTNYQLTKEALELMRAFGKPSFERKCRRFIESHGALSALYRGSRNLVQVPVTLPDGTSLKLSPGSHNELQKLVVEDFAARFAPGASVVYVGDTAKKTVVVADGLLHDLGIPDLKHDKLPDVVLYDRARNWLFLIEAVTSHGPVSPKRHVELEKMMAKCAASRIYVTAFKDFAGFRRRAAEIVWESEVWIAEFPEHMIHFNGDRFLGPYPRQQ